MSSLDDFLSLKPKGSLGGGAEGAVHDGLDSPLKPTTVGLKLIDAPNNLSNGLAYRVNGSTLERIMISDDGGDENSTSATVVASCSLSQEGLHIKASPDGRMVAVACIDGSLQCFDSTTDGMSLRWSMETAHSHVSPNIYSTISKDRSNGACNAGPLLALDFSPNDYILLLVDATRGAAMYDAKVAAPTNLVASQTQQLLQNVSCASWRASTNASSSMPLAIGKYDGSVTILEYTGDATAELLKTASDLGSPSEEDGFVCTHLNWSNETLIAGLCLVVPPEDDEEPESDDEDDLAEHEACLYVTSIDDTLNRSADWSEQGDVVPFFTVPKFGRHVFYTSVLCSQKQLIAVATNVGTDIGTLSPEDGEGGWVPVEFQEGAAATTPTNEDDEFVFPLGICLVQLPSSSFRLLLASTDGSISTFEYQHMNDEAFFATPTLGSVEDLPSEPLAIAAAAEPSEASSTPDNASWVVVDETNAADSEESKPTVVESDKAPETKAETAAPTIASTPFSFGVSGSSTFGSGAKLSSSSPFGSSTFGSGTSKGLTFGSPSSSGESPFAAFSKKGTSSSIFGATSSLGGSSGFGTTSTFGSGTATPAFGSATTTPSKPAAKPSTGFGSSSFGSTTFGSTTTPAGGGFAALSSNSTTGGFGSSTSTGSGGGGFGSGSGGFGSTSADKSAFGSGKSPFKMFGSPSKPSTTTTTASGFPTKPLFGSAPAPTPAAPVEDTTPAGTESETKVPAVDTKPEPSKDKEEHQESNDAPLSDTEKAAAKVFDEFDTEKTKLLDVSKFEDLSEALGEGFHGDEYDAQVALVDPTKSGKITRDNFIQWYKSLVEGGDSDDESLDTAELEEREEERQSAKEAFSTLSKTEGDKAYIEVDDFGKVIESMGSTYCEEEHRKTIRKLKKDDRIYESDFLEWYIDWLFGDEDSDDESDEESTGDEPASTDQGDGEAKTESLASIFKVDESMWKCEVCSVRNKDSVNKCISCETPRPGFENTASKAGGDAPTFGGAATSSSSIGAGGFSFGGSSTATSSSAIGASGFSFGGPAPSSSSIGSGGFSFGGSTAKSDTKEKSDSAPSTSAIGAGGFSFGGAASTATTDTATKAKTDSAPSSSSIGAGGFSFGGASTTKTDETTKKPDSSTSIGAGGFSFGGAATAKSDKTVAKEPEVSANDDKDLSDTEKAAAKVFDEFDTEKTKSLDVSKFEDLSEALGEGFHGDEYDAQVALVDPTKSGEITRDNFIQWYKGLVEGGDSDDESLDTAELEEREEERQSAKEAFSTLSKTEGDKAYIEVDDFGKVIESMGSTYCEEEHRKTIKKLKKDDGRIYESDFLEWYIDWLFGDEDSDDESDDESAGGEPASTDNGSEEKTESLASIFKVDESMWKCEVCSVRNKDSVNKCISCESPRPGYEGDSKPEGGTSKIGDATSSSAIGASGFSFGGPAPSSSSIGSGGFSFGGSAPKPDVTSSSAIGASGFSFGGSTAKPDAAPSSGGFSFGASTAKPDKASSTSIGAGGFTFGGSTAKPDAAPSSGGFSFGAKTETKTSTPSKTPTAAKPDAAKSSSAAFPPMSKKAPTNPFGAKPAAKAPASSAAFPPMSAKAPTNPFGAKPAAKAPASSAAFPPMSAKAPTNPFGAKPVAKPAAKASPSSAAFPPMSAKAPTNPFGAKPVVKAPASSAAFPPMSAKAPTNPFGAKPAAKPAAKAPVSSAAFPPISAKAPTNPFGAKSAAQAPSSAAFPPMSAKAPTNPFGSKSGSTNPFGSFGAKSGETSTSKSPFAAFSAKPASSNPFGAFGSKSSGNAPAFGAKPAAQTSSGSTTNAAFPPMSTKAPTNPFGAKPATKAPASSTNAAFPPMSSKAPTNPFGAKPAAKPASKSPAGSAAFPPMSAKAPSNPFGAKSPAKAPASSTNASFPPMSAKAPTNPFGAKPTAKASSKSSANAAFPPMSAKAPTNPFGAKPIAKAPTSSTNAAFPPMSAKAPTNPFGVKPAGKTLASSAKTTASLAPTDSSGFGGSASQKSKSQALVAKKKKSEMQIQLDSVMSSFSSTVSKVSQMRAEVSTGDREIREEIESFAIQTENERSKLLNLDDSLGKNRSETAFLLSRKTDATRQVDAANKIVQEVKLSNAEGTQSIAGSQALDQESEAQRRKFAASSRSVVRKTALIAERAELLEGTLNDPTNNHRCLLNGVLTLYQRSKGFEEVTSRITSNVDQASKSVPHYSRTKRSAGRSTYSLDSIDNSTFTPPRRKNKPLPINIGSAKKPVKSKTSVSHWKGIESSLQQLGKASVKVNRFNSLSSGGNKDQIQKIKSRVGERNTPTRSLLMSPSKYQSPNAGHERALTLSNKINIFSPPAKTKARSGWDKPSTIDRNQISKLAINAPKDLKQTTLSNASRETLASFGTTPEKLRAAVDIKKNEAASIPSSVGSAKSKEGQMKRSTGGSAAFPPLSSKAPSNPFSTAKKVETPKPVASEKKSSQKSAPSSAPLPPMSLKAPTNPFAKASASKPPLSQAQGKPSTSAKPSAFGAGEKTTKKESPAPSTTFGNMKGLGDSLFSSGSTQKDTKQQPSFGAASNSNSPKDYKAILTSFYQKHNASKLGEVDKTIAKYKGREQEMFQKLAAKYKVPNPLQESPKPTSGFSSSSGFGNLGSSSSAPTSTPSSGFGSTSSTMGASTFGSPSGTSAQQKPAVSSSPFGKPAANSTPFGKPAANATPFGSSTSQSPFGSSGTQNTSTPFGSASAPAPSPFGTTASSTTSSSPFGSAAGGLSSASPFGSTAAPTPFGAPSPSPMQQGSQRLFNGKSARDLLLQFYQEKNPSKVSEVDKLLAKYSGKEDQMFRNLAKKYQLNPSVFGVSAGAPAPSSGFGAASATPAFGQASAMGSGASPFGQSSGGFGQPSTFGGAPKPSGSTFGSTGFGSSGGFGSLAQSSSPSPFGGQSGGFGSPAPAFGSASPFGAPRR